MEKQTKLYCKWWFWVCIVLIIICITCICYFSFNKSINVNSDMSNNSKQDKTNKSQLTAEEITNKLKEKGLNIGKIVVYTEETDLNNLLGRPNQYISKVQFEDTRLSQEFIEDNDAKGGTIETFNNKEDMQKRKNYIESISSSSSIFAQYIYGNEYVLLRLDNELTPSQAKEYETTFNEIMNNN